MASQTRVNPVAAYTNGAGVDASGHTHSVLFSVAQLKAITVDCGGSLAAQGGIGGAIEAVFREVQPLMFESTGTSGVIHLVVDGHANTAASIQARIIALGTVNGYSFASASATDGTHIVVS
jgi:hypothetical protein